MRGSLSRLADGTRLRVDGAPTDEEVAAVVVALDAAAAAAEGARAADSPARASGWRRAARIEAVGGRPRADAADVRSPD